MTKHPTIAIRRLRFATGVWVALLTFVAVSAESDTGRVTPNSSAKTGERDSPLLDRLLPTAWQKRPSVQFNAITEFTPEGRKLRVPTPEQPMYYFASPARYAL